METLFRAPGRGLTDAVLTHAGARRCRWHATRASSARTEANRAQPPRHQTPGAPSCLRTRAASAEACVAVLCRATAARCSPGAPSHTTSRRLLLSSSPQLLGQPSTGAPPSQLPRAHLAAPASRRTTHHLNQTAAALRAPPVDPTSPRLLAIPDATLHPPRATIRCIRDAPSPTQPMLPCCVRPSIARRHSRDSIRDELNVQVAPLAPTPRGYARDAIVAYPHGIVAYASAAT